MSASNAKIRINIDVISARIVTKFNGTFGNASVTIDAFIWVYGHDWRKLRHLPLPIITLNEYDPDKFVIYPNSNKECKEKFG